MKAAETFIAILIAAFLPFALAAAFPDTGEASSGDAGKRTRSQTISKKSFINLGPYGMAARRVSINGSESLWSLRLFKSGNLRHEAFAESGGKPRIQLVEETPRPGCSSLVGTAFSGGAHCCTTAIVATVCRASDASVLLDLAHLPEIEFIDADGNGALEIRLDDFQFAYEPPFSFASSPVMERLLVFDSNRWRVDRPGEFSEFHRKNASRFAATTRENQSASADDVQEWNARAIMAAYHEIMSGSVPGEVRTRFVSALKSGPESDPPETVFETILERVESFNPIPEEPDADGGGDIKKPLNIGSRNVGGGHP